MVSSANCHAPKALFQLSIRHPFSLQTPVATAAKGAEIVSGSEATTAITVETNMAD